MGCIRKETLPAVVLAVVIKISATAALGSTPMSRLPQRRHLKILFFLHFGKKLLTSRLSKNISTEL
jgi:hypothetical protein